MLVVRGAPTRPHPATPSPASHRLTGPHCARAWLLRARVLDPTVGVEHMQHPTQQHILRRAHDGPCYSSLLNPLLTAVRTFSSHTGWQRLLQVPEHWWVCASPDLLAPTASTPRMPCCACLRVALSWTRPSPPPPCRLQGDKQGRKGGGEGVRPGEGKVAALLGRVESNGADPWRRCYFSPACAA